MDNKAADKKLALNFFDILVIIVVIVAAGIFVVMQMRDTGGAVTGSKTGQVEYQIELKEISESTVGMIKEGDIIVDKIKKFDMGKVEKVEYYPATKEATDYETGNTVYTEIPGVQAACITLIADCSETESAFVVDGGYEARVGTEISVLGPGYSGSGFVIGISRGEE